ncbi:hypothetical protein EOPP23_08585 [Endozoicomonas sp. OPT23]|uniref:ABC transporter ATP-binding protein n=1 Tax=Endozoicomonas sp. OPT23 TaxID=2072845 RepID=UPI00129A160B|nr:ABC transporter ATP-binding protein [Endozoicomonas sp. OPT23]MRI33038.1 hypothetical protein [Endozoicomonas sp. OPT23]
MDQPSLSLQQTSFAVGSKKILEPLNIDIEPGKVTAILGPNGSGKSTLLKLLSGLIEPSSGQILLNDSSLKQIKRSDLARQLTMLPQHSPVPLGMKVSDLVACGRHPYSGPFGRLKPEDHQAVSEALARVEMDHHADSLVDHLSGGEMQRVWLAMVLAQQTGILLLDEPTSWLDINHQLRLLDIVKILNHEQKTTIVWILHDLNQALQYSDNIILMNQGQLVAQGRSEDVLDEQIIKDVFSVEMARVTLPGSTQPIFIPNTQSSSSHKSAHSNIKEVA